MNKILAMLVIAMIFASPCLAKDSAKMTAEDRYVDYKLYEGVASNMVMALNAQLKCAEASDDMALRAKNKMSAGFTAAKVAWLQNKPTKAIGILEELVQKHENADSGQEFIPSVAVAGNYWIATIARHYGDVPRAQKAYADVLKYVVAGDEKLRALAVYCHLYEAEVEATIFIRKDIALEALEKIKQMPPVLKQGKDEGWNIFQEWADYQILTLKRGVEEARSSIKGRAEKSQIAITIAEAQLSISGIKGRTGCDVFFSGNQISMALQALQSVLEVRTSPIDRSLALLGLGYESELRKKPVEAEKYYADLFNGDSFFAPEGGIRLAQCQKQQGKIEDAKKTFSRIKERFPGYSKLVEDLSER